MNYPKYLNWNKTFSDGKSPEVLQMNQIAPQNILIKLSGREMWGGRRPGSEKYAQRSMYQSLFPNFTISHVEKPPCFLRKFTPDGKYFIAFSSDQTSVEVYTFRGPQGAANLFQRSDKLPSWLKFNKSYTGKEQSVHDELGDHISPDKNDEHSQSIRRNIFDCFFKLKFRVRVAAPGALLNRECSLFTHDSKYIIVGSAAFINEENEADYDMFRNNESLERDPLFPLENYSIHIVDIRNGILTDTKSFKFDKIYLNHNQGLYLYNSILAVLSVQHQTVYIFHLSENGQFQEVRKIGRFCYENDELVTTPLITGPSYKEAFFNSLKHRLLAHLYLHMKNDGSSNENFPLKRFYQYFEQFQKLKIWKMQLLDENHLLLKYSNENVVTLKASELNSQNCLFVIYNILNTNIIAVYENTSNEFVDLFESFADLFESFADLFESFRNNFLTQEARYLSSPSNNIFTRQIHQRFRETITSSRFGGPAQLPISSQSFSSSPYLDQALFSYDHHRVSSMERPKALPRNGIRFYGRDSDLYKFQIHASYVNPRSELIHSEKRLVSYTFHPHAPFAISVQRQDAEYFVNFHIRVDQQSTNYFI